MLNINSFYKRLAKVIHILIIACLLVPAIKAKQIDFNKTLIDDHFQFNYQWEDHLKRPQNIRFNLSKKSIYNRYRNFAIYQPKLAHEYVNKAIRKHLKKSPIKGVDVSFMRNGDKFSAQLKGKNNTLLQQANIKISQLEKRYFQAYLDKKHFHQFSTHHQTIGIKPNHIRIAEESVSDLKPLKAIILEKSSVKNIRKVSNFVLSFIQSIPYSTLISRTTSSGAGFNPPLKILWENQGDCDSKVTLAAALLRALMPRIKMAFIYIDNHALLGIALDIKNNDVTVAHQGTTYVLSEPTGPAILALGTISGESEQAILNGHYSLETFHAKRKTQKVAIDENKKTMPISGDVTL